MPQLLFCVYRCLLRYDEEEFLGRFATIVMFYGLISCNSLHDWENAGLQQHKYKHYCLEIYVTTETDGYC